MHMHRVILCLWIVLLAACAAPQRETPHYELAITGGLVHDGSGDAPRALTVAVNGDRVAALLAPEAVFTADRRVDATGMAVAPGFINMLSWATESLIEDGRGLSDLKQGVTLEIFGEGWSMGPLNEAMKAEALRQQGDIRYEIAWTSLAEYLDHLVERGVAMNVASFVGATTVRIHELGYEDRDPTPQELARMQALVDRAMREGALGVGASLIYAPAFYADTGELVALAKAAGAHGGGYITHMRSEGERLLEAVEETVRIAREAGVRAEIYHLKAAGENNWPKMAQAIARIDAARADGVDIGADMYAYTAGATGLYAAMPPWVQEGGHDAWVARLKDPAIRARVLREMRTPSDEWENLYLAAGSPERVLFIGFRNERLKPLTGKSLAEVAAMRGTTPEDTIIDLVIEDDSRVDTAYFLMSEENVRLGIRQPWVSFGSDAEASAPEGVFLKSSTHPRAYGNFARLLGHYARDEGLMTQAEAISRVTRLPARNWKLEGRGCLDPGCYADLVVFDPDTIIDRATFARPQQFATGVREVFVNGVQALAGGEPTGALPGRVVRGPGWQPAPASRH
ncbi:MAG TPA: amidohydrolase family protein [Xanthomonadaceae bacterium]|nr:amidohydrolase family protein [Xanthomonadaceae bacterium]